MNVQFKSKEFEKYVYVKLNKDIEEELTLSDLGQVHDVSINQLNIRGEVIDTTMLDLLFFKNLRELTIQNFEINEHNVVYLEKLENLQNLSLSSCKFSDGIALKLNKSTETLRINACENMHFGLFSSENNIKNLYIRNIDLERVGALNLNNINNLQQLEKLEMQNCDEITNIQQISGLAKLLSLNIDGSTVDDPNFIQELKQRMKVSDEKESYLIG